MVSLAGRCGLAAAAAAAAFSWAGCNKVALLAPSGTVISLYAGSTVLALQGGTDLTAVVIENGQASTGTGTGGSTTGTTGAGTAVQDGTVIDFTTTLGTISPAQAKTSGGQVTVHLNAGATSGTATVTAYSGGATSKPLTVTIGAAAVSSVTVTANPSALPALGGTATISALALDANGNGVPNIPVVFSTTAGSLSATNATTGDTGVATVTLTTTAAGSSTSPVTVTAAAGAKTNTVNVTINQTPTATVSVTPSASAAVSTPVTFTIATAATSASGAASTVTDAVIDFGDGTTQDLGAIGATQSATYIYSSSDIFKVTVTITTSDGLTRSGSTTVAVGPLSASVLASPSTVSPNTPTTFMATVTPAGAWIDHYEWNFGDGWTDSTGGNSDGHTYVSQGAYHVSVTVFPKYGHALAPATTTVTVVVGGSGDR